MGIGKCQCSSLLTCRYCLENAKPYYWTCDDGTVIIIPRGSR